jgi:diguanylate cyclase (GGDEF)-like protein
MLGVLDLTGQWQGEIWNRRKNGEIYAEWLTINSILHADGTLHRRVALFSDITERKRADELIWNQANFDQLTNLPNRRMFRDRLSQGIKKSNRSGETLALLILDLDHFKEVNDTLGHDLGDALLVEAALRITACVRESDTVARLGGDEFTIILTDLEDTSSVERVAEEIIQSLNQPFNLNGNLAYLSASIGITLFPDDATEQEELIKNADQAMYVSKRAGRNCFSYFTNAMQKIAKHRLQIISDLRIAIAEAQFQLFYQPIVELATGKIHKAEALLRWFHPTRGMISPAEFIPLAEESGLINEIGEFVIGTSAKQILNWRSRYGDDFQISVNISPVQIQTKNTLTEWLHRLGSMGLSGQNFVFEITEGLLLDTTPHVTDQLLAFRDAGIQVAIDDFGTGYSALSYLKKLDIDYLKIDRSFIHQITPESSDLALCEAIIVMAHKLGLKVIAEGVETHEQNSLLAAIGCDYVQGYFNSMPIPAQQFESYMQQR